MQIAEILKLSSYKSTYVAENVLARYYLVTYEADAFSPSRWFLGYTGFMRLLIYRYVTLHFVN